jgi:hypothetical protein
MSLSDTILFLAACYGLTLILTRGRIFRAVRPRAHFFHCAQCTGFWVGAVMIWIFWLAHVSFRPDVVWTFVCACASSGTSYVLGSLVRDGGVSLTFTDGGVVDKCLPLKSE